MPDGVVELSPLVTMYPVWTAELSDPGIQQCIGHRDSFLVWYSTGRTVPTEAILHSDNVLHAIRCFRHGTNQVNVQTLSREAVLPGLVLATLQVHLLDLG